MDEQTRDKMLHRLKNIGGYLWYGSSSGYGVSAGVYSLNDEGVRGPQSVTSSPVIMTKEEYAEAKRLIAEGKEDEVDMDILQMIEEDCEPDVKYFHDYGSDYWEWDDHIYEALSYHDLEKWDDMTDGELEEWCNILDLLEQGLESWYQL